MPRFVLLLSCPDRPGLVHGVAEWVLSVGGNIVEADQHTERAGEPVFVQRIELDAEGTRAELEEAFAPVGRRFEIDYEVHEAGRRGRVAILVSRQGHCLADLLSRVTLGELPAEVVGVVSNHETHRGMVEAAGIPFTHLPVDDDDRGSQEAQLLQRLDDLAPELVVLARYMRVLPAPIVERFARQMINIHHSFLPAFAGAQPYRRAYERGVKLIGATAHYVTEHLDEGPIIAQDVTHVTHRDDATALALRGGDLERVVLASAVRLHLEHRVIVCGDRTVVFG